MNIIQELQPSLLQLQYAFDSVNFPDGHEQLTAFIVNKRPNPKALIYILKSTRNVYLLKSLFEVFVLLMNDDNQDIPNYLETGEFLDFFIKFDEFTTDLKQDQITDLVIYLQTFIEFLTAGSQIIDILRQLIIVKLYSNENVVNLYICSKCQLRTFKPHICGTKLVKVGSNDHFQKAPWIPTDDWLRGDSIGERRDIEKQIVILGQ